MSSHEGPRSSWSILRSKSVPAAIFELMIDILQERSRLERLDMVKEKVSGLVPVDPTLRTKEHSIGVAFLARELCTVMVERDLLSEERVPSIVLGARLHDIGKTDQIRDLLKQENLSEEERRRLKGHTAAGIYTLWAFLGENPQIQEFPGFASEISRAALIILYHHERMDGSGPQHLKGQKIPMGARIVGLADQFDSLIHGKRILVDGQEKYRRPPLDIDEALDKIKSQEEKWDPQVVKALEEVVEKNKKDLLS